MILYLSMKQSKKLDQECFDMVGAIKTAEQVCRAQKNI